MDNLRLFLFIGISMVVLLLWQAWQEDYGPKPVAPTATATTGTEGEAAPAPQDIPSPPATPAADASAAAGDKPATVQAAPRGERIRVRTDVLDVEIDTRGGDVRRAQLIQYPVELKNPDVPVELMKDQGAELFFSQSGLLSDSGEVPDHHAIYTSAQPAYQLAEGQNELHVDLTWQGKDGLAVTKRYTFTRDSYAMQVSYTIANNGAQPRKVRQYRQLQRTPPSAENTSHFIYTYTGGVLYSPENKYEKIDFDDMADAPLARDFADGWAAMIQHYFLGAWIPDAGERNHYYTKALDGGRYVLGMVGQNRSLEPGASTTLTSQLYIGPKLQDHLAEIAPGLELTVDYGMLTFIAQPIFWLLEVIHDVVKNWGWAIIILTLLIKLAFYKLSEASYKSMANMRKLQPRLMALKERFGDDRQKLNEAMMKMYKEEKINPLGGCLPILIQIPVFIALYWVLLESVEMRQAPFALWLNDLSSPDPFYVLPLLMGVTMFIQQKLNPAPLDPIQAKVMMILPVVFTVFFVFFPSGLVLYWVVNNALSIAQQWVITKRIEGGAKA